MKKLICALLVATMLLGSLVAFAGNCNHHAGATPREQRVTIDSCHYKIITTYYCDACNEEVDSLVEYFENHRYVWEIIDGEEKQICSKCDDIK